VILLSCVRKFQLGHDRLPPHLLNSLKKPDIDTTQAELLTASLNSRRLSRLVFTSAFCPISHPPPSAPRAVTSKVHLHSGHSALVMQKPTPQAFKTKMRSKGSSEHVRTFLNGYAPHTRPKNCAVRCPTNSHSSYSHYPTNTAVRPVVYTTGSGTSA